MLFATSPPATCATPFLSFLFPLVCVGIGGFTVVRGKKLKDISHRDNQPDSTMDESAELVETERAASDQQLEGVLQRSIDLLRAAAEMASTEVRLTCAELRNPKPDADVDPNPIACDSSLLGCCGDAFSCACGMIYAPCFFCCFYGRNRERAGLGSCCGSCLWLVLGPPVAAFLGSWFCESRSLLFAR